MVVAVVDAVDGRHYPARAHQIYSGCWSRQGNKANNLGLGEGEGGFVPVGPD